MFCKIKDSFLCNFYIGEIYLRSMVDPDDFTDNTEPEGEEETNPKAGYPGVGGMTTEDAEKAYNRAKDQHFQDDTPHSPTPSTEPNQDQHKTMPQIGSVEESEDQDMD